MALVRPFRAFVFGHEPAQDVSTLVAPPYDVVTPEQRENLLAANRHNVVALELPEGPLDSTAPGNRYETGHARWRAWRESGVIVQDTADAIYVLDQTWEYRGRRVHRRAFIAAVRLHPFADGVILPHERTLPKALDDRLRLTRATAANLSQVLSLFSDPEDVTGPIFDAAMQREPMMHATDADGVESRVWAIHESEMLDSIVATVAQGPLFIADGHHRYTTALSYRDERRDQDRAAGRSPVEPAYDFVMMALVSMSDPDLIVLPTHRLARAPGTFEEDSFWAALAENFDLATFRGGNPADALADLERSAFVIRTTDGSTRLATLRRGVDPALSITDAHSADWKRLDVTVLQEMILRPLFGIDPRDPHSLERLSFVTDDQKALELRGADVAFIVAPTRMDQLRAVALAGETMPQKSTYFYPKLLSGLLFRSLD